MDINIKIDAPGLEGAIHTLAQVLAKYDLPTDASKHKQAEETPAQTQQQQQPEQQAPQQAVPVQQNQAPVQQPDPVQQPEPQQEQQGVPTENPTYNMDQLAVAATQLMDAGKRDALISLLGEFNVQALTALPQEQYGAFATRLRELGAKI